MWCLSPFHQSIRARDVSMARKTIQFRLNKKCFSIFVQLHNTKHFTCLLTTKGSGEVRQGWYRTFEALKGEYEVKLTNSYWLFYYLCRALDRKLKDFLLQTFCIINKVKKFYRCLIELDDHLSRLAHSFVGFEYLWRCSFISYKNFLEGAFKSFSRGHCQSSF